MPPVIAVALVAAIPALEGAMIAGISVVGVLSNVVFTGVMFGVSKLMSPGQQAAPTYKAPASGPVATEAVAQAVAERTWSYGRVRTGGNFMTRGSDGITYYCGIVLTCRPIDGVEQFFVDDEPMSLSTGPALHQYNRPNNLPGVISIDEGPNVQWPNRGQKWVTFFTYQWNPSLRTQDPVVIGYGPAGYIEFRNARPEGAPSDLLRKYFPSIWGNDHKACGLTCLYSTWRKDATTNRNTAYPRWWPTHSTAFRASRIYDPRERSQTFLDPAGVWSVYNDTWRWSANPALQIADYLVHPEGGKRSYDDINWESFKAAASYCDRLVPVFGGGYEPFAQSHLTVSTAQSPRSVLGKLLPACDGVIWEDPNGKVTLWIQQWEEPVVTLTDADLGDIRFKEGNGVLADINYLEITYVEPRSNFAKNTAVPAWDDASLSQVGQRKATIDFEAVLSPNQAYRLGTRALRRKMTPLHLSAVCGPRGLLADGQRVVRIDSALCGIQGVFRVVAMSIQSLSTVVMQFEEVTPEMYEDVVPNRDSINPSLPGLVMIAPFTPITPYPPTLTVNTINGIVTLTASVLPPPSMPQLPGSLPGQYTDTSSAIRFRSRPVAPLSLVPVGDGSWTAWSDYVDRYVAVSGVIAGVQGQSQTYEVQAWFVSATGITGASSASSYASISF